MSADANQQVPSYMEQWMPFRATTHLFKTCLLLLLLLLLSYLSGKNDPSRQFFGNWGNPLNWLLGLPWMLRRGNEAIMKHTAGNSFPWGSKDKLWSDFRFFSSNFVLINWCSPTPSFINPSLCRAFTSIVSSIYALPSHPANHDDHDQ